MNYSLRFHPLVGQDLETIVRWIIDHAGSEAAGQRLEEIEQAIVGLAHMPHKGSVRDEIAHGLRAIPAGRKAVIAFTVDDAAVFIQAVLRRADWAARRLVWCLTNTLTNLRVLLAVGCVALPRVVPATGRVAPCRQRNALAECPVRLIRMVRCAGFRRRQGAMTGATGGRPRGGHHARKSNAADGEKDQQITMRINRTTRPPDYPVLAGFGHRRIHARVLGRLARNSREPSRSRRSRSMSFATSTS